MNVGVSAKVAAEGEGSMATEAAYQSGAKWFQFQTDYYFDHDVTVVFGTGGYDGDEHYQYSSNGTYRRVRRVKILMQCRGGQVDDSLPRSEGAPICRSGCHLLYRWRARVQETGAGHGRSASARIRACQTDAREGEEEWRIAHQDLAPVICRQAPHAAKLCLAGPLRSGEWLEVTRELRETRQVAVSFD
ncbi:unnamed protein product [Prorocentrum cordatum]|uniref:Uncharacterized protein n=1 Tax=Prorocentrum cordatum TaxID=2364126 RepID=A0ABN9R344_9DINO|nr:unnamed protein product [Polarella glacialis]